MQVTFRAQTVFASGTSLAHVNLATTEYHTMRSEHREKNTPRENSPRDKETLNQTPSSFHAAQRRWIWHPPSAQDRPVACVGSSDRIVYESGHDDGWTAAEIIAALRWMHEARHALDVCSRRTPMYSPNDGGRRPPRVVCIDDDLDFMAVLRRRLEQLGLVVTSATNALRGYRTVLQEQPDLVIADYFMPTEYGTYVLRRMKEDAHLEKLPVIVLTGRDISAWIGPKRDVTLEQQLRSLGAATILTKPLNQRSLEAAVQKCLSLNADQGPFAEWPDCAG
jgi:two-component system response regulator MprA/two-component system response regulator GlrR